MNETRTILDPIASYADFKEQFSKENTNWFQEMLDKSNIDVEENKRSASKVFQLEQKYENIASKAKRYRILYTIILILDIAILFLGVGYTINNSTDALFFALCIIAVLGVVSILTVLYYKIKKNKYNKLIKQNIELGKIINKKKEECYKQLLPLTNQFYDNMVDRLIGKVLPNIQIDKLFSIERYADMAERYSLPERPDKDESIISIKSGDIFGNPYLLLNKNVRSIIMQPYTGSRVVSWTEYTYENGKRVSHSRSQTLTATVVKPKPVIDVETELLYLNAAAPNLDFSRSCDFVHKLSERRLKRHIKWTHKKLEFIVLRQLKKGKGNVELMGNIDFEALFNAINRNNEIEYRLLFTPLAQQNMIKILRDPEFGDTFSFDKIGMVNSIKEYYGWNIDLNKNEYLHYSLDKVKDLFISNNEQYFHNFYKIFAPLLAIPMYQENKSLDYIYDDRYPFHYNPYLQEAIANNLDYSFEHVRSDTEPILKTQFVESLENNDLVTVTAHSHFIEKLTDTVSVMAANGRYYDVNVHWDNYVPLSQETQIDILENPGGKLKHIEDKLNQEYYRYDSTKNILAVIHKYLEN